MGGGFCSRSQDSRKRGGGREGRTQAASRIGGFTQRPWQETLLGRPSCVAVGATPRGWVLSQASPAIRETSPGQCGDCRSGGRASSRPGRVRTSQAPGQRVAQKVTPEAGPGWPRRAPGWAQKAKPAPPPPQQPQVSTLPGDMAPEGALGRALSSLCHRLLEHRPTVSMTTFGHLWALGCVPSAPGPQGRRDPPFSMPFRTRVYAGGSIPLRVGRAGV